VQNFDAADTNGDGKVSFKEAMSFDQASRSSSSSATSAADTATSTSADTSSTQLMQQIMRLMQAYNVGETRGGSTTSLLSVAA
jgi:hypothetical protein